MSINIDPQEMYVWLAYEDGYRKAIGTIAEIDGIEFAIVPKKTEDGSLKIIFSELKSGNIFLVLPFSTIEVAWCDTKEKTLTMFKEKALAVEELINKVGREKLIKRIKERTLFTENKIGKMPEIEVYPIPIGSEE